MFKKRLYSSMLAVVTVISAITGCSSTSNPSKTETGTQALGGSKLVYWAELNQSVSANYSNLGETPFAKAWQERTGTQIEFQHPPAKQQKEQFSLLVADGNLPDLMEYPWMTYPGGPEKAIKDGNIIALNETFEKHCPNLMKYLKANPDIDKMIKTDEGNYYVFPFIRGEDALCNTIGPMVRQDWLDDLGLEVPTTIDEWYTVLTMLST